MLDAHGEPVPVGVAGELYVGGAGVARGYLNRPELTAERFVPDPFSSAARERGCTARAIWRGGCRTASLEYLGRNDHQVKIRGFRIELGEIEARAGRACGGARGGGAGARGRPGDRRLVAYVRAGRRAVTVAKPTSCGRTCCRRLPEYMVPAAFVVLEALPLTAERQAGSQGAAGAGR